MITKGLEHFHVMTDKRHKRVGNVQHREEMAQGSHPCVEESDGTV